MADKKYKISITEDGVVTDVTGIEGAQVPAEARDKIVGKQLVSISCVWRPGPGGTLQ